MIVCVVCAVLGKLGYRVVALGVDIDAALTQRANTKYGSDAAAASASSSASGTAATTPLNVKFAHCDVMDEKSASAVLSSFLNEHKRGTLLYA